MANRSAQCLDENNDKHQRKTGEEHKPPCTGGDITHGLGEYDTDCRLLGRHAEAEECKTGLVHDGMGELEDKTDKELRQDVGDYMLCRNPEGRLAEAARAENKLLVTHLKHLGSDKTRERCPVRQRDTDKKSRCALREGDGDKYEQDRVRHAHEYVDKPVYRMVYPALAERRRDADDKTDDGGDDGGGRADDEAQRKTLDGSHEHIAPEVVSAEGVLERGREEFLVEVCTQCAVRQKGAGNINGDKNENDDCGNYNTCKSAVSLFQFLPPSLV